MRRVDSGFVGVLWSAERRVVGVGSTGVVFGRRLFYGQTGSSGSGVQKRRSDSEFANDVDAVYDDAYACGDESVLEYRLWSRRG